MMVVMGRVALRDGLDIQGATATLRAEMAAHRLARIAVRFQMPGKLSEADRAKLEQASETCPIHHALKLAVPIAVEFAWPT
ncbi:MAG: OsmC family protein [Planctomycetes bacterium]|nr:OsmC family protein [Planctomycetota bacterium]